MTTEENGFILLSPLDNSLYLLLKSSYKFLTVLEFSLFSSPSLLSLFSSPSFSKRVLMLSWLTWSPYVLQGGFKFLAFSLSLPNNRFGIFLKSSFYTTATRLEIQGLKKGQGIIGHSKGKHQLES